MKNVARELVASERQPPASSLHPAAAVQAVCSFSGGKDSCLALWRAQQAGTLDVRTLLVMLDETGERSRSHAIPPLLLQRQAQALNLELVMRSATWQSYEDVFTQALRELHALNYEAAVFGDIDLQAHRDWEEKVCAAAGMRAVLPLWGADRSLLAREVLDSGFRAMVVCTDSRFLSDDYCGRAYDESFLRDLPSGVDACGENGEFHTFVIDGPNFSHPVEYRLEGFVNVFTPPEFGAVRYRFARLE